MFISATTPGIIFNNLLILGSRVLDTANQKTIPGDIRAFNVLTGDIVWTFNTIPRLGETGYDSWPKDSWKNEYLTVNSWEDLHLIRKMVLFFGTGSPSYDHWGEIELVIIFLKLYNCTRGKHWKKNLALSNCSP